MKLTLGFLLVFTSSIFAQSNFSFYGATVDLKDDWGILPQSSSNNSDNYLDVPDKIKKRIVKSHRKNQAYLFQDSTGMTKARVAIKKGGPKNIPNTKNAYKESCNSVMKTPHTPKMKFLACEPYQFKGKWYMKLKGIAKVNGMSITSISIQSLRQNGDMIQFGVYTDTDQKFQRDIKRFNPTGFWEDKRTK